MTERIKQDAALKLTGLESTGRMLSENHQHRPKFNQKNAKNQTKCERTTNGEGNRLKQAKSKRKSLAIMKTLKNLQNGLKKARISPNLPNRRANMENALENDEFNQHQQTLKSMQQRCKLQRKAAFLQKTI